VTWPSCSWPALALYPASRRAFKADAPIHVGDALLLSASRRRGGGGDMGPSESGLQAALAQINARLDEVLSRQGEHDARLRIVEQMLAEMRGRGSVQDYERITGRLGALEAHKHSLGAKVAVMWAVLTAFVAAGVSAVVAYLFRGGR
jgi:hypothetical protein